MLRYRILPVTAFAQNTCLVWDDATQEAVFTDPGGEVDRLLQAVIDAGVTLRAVWLTHAHIDHAGAAAEVAQRAGVPIIGPHPGDQFWIDALPQQAQMFGFPDVRSFTPDRWLQQGDTVRFGQVELRVLHCPGHTPGHVVFFSDAARLAVVGDVLFRGSVGRTDFPKGNFDALIASIRQKLWPLGDDVAFISGHGPMSTFGEERLNNPFCGDWS